ncbi:MAG TPA: YlqD family protein [Candidatus Avacidaminococcus intestinavium]|uniref:YlqD family protein n=1 Tax=Candidatus Avacidaminococcus intestinavium TaxID=2840684 RepID=A0A9D1MNQ7_9FIRM|nr:YlqD family protein [Candidatus Avacidaminococcus intestinavium]
MDKMTVRMPVAVKAKVTESLKTKLIADLERRIQQINLDIEQFEFTAKRALNEQENHDSSLIPALQHQIEDERAKRVAAKQEAEDKLKRAEKLEYGAEIGHGQLERTVELEIGTDLDKLLGAEIVTEDGKIVAFRA